VSAPAESLTEIVKKFEKTKETKYASLYRVHLQQLIANGWSTFSFQFGDIKLEWTGKAEDMHRATNLILEVMEKINQNPGEGEPYKPNGKTAQGYA